MAGASCSNRLRVCFLFFFFSSRRRHTRSDRDWSSDVCSSDLDRPGAADSHADRRLLLWHPLGAAIVRGGAPQPGVSLVLWIGSRRRSARSFDLLEEPPRRFRNSDLLRRLFETVLQRCIDEGLVGGEGFAVDASLIQADASDRTRIEGAAGLPPDAVGRAVEEYIAVLDDAAFGAASEVTPKFIAPADPATRWTAAHRGIAFFAYSNNYLIDVENAIIVDVEATTAIRQAEILAAKRMIERSLEHFDLDPERLIGDTAYGSAEMLNWLVHERGIEPHIPVFDKSQRTDGTFSREDFTYDHARDA